MNDELWEKVKMLRDVNANWKHELRELQHGKPYVRASEAIACYETVCRLAGRPLPEWRPEQKESKL